MTAAQGAAQAVSKPPQAASAATGAETLAHGKTILLWPGGAPQAVGKTPEDMPALTIFLPAKNTTKTGVVVAPGGGYAHLSM